MNKSALLCYSIGANHCLGASLVYKEENERKLIEKERKDQLRAKISRNESRLL